ncbi:chorismate synthase [Atopobacter sp. AH10]|uniref:chorismate synthase n=1 Tax=Atopobacter sp. AH10 TaxID=2315861 RepID=UPI000EF25A38|nr:chorismate synthase [Atopobacter sp. AH10]RLK64153.1 chorismate synthase [Atopobacter sp. AH10]
MNGIWGNHLQLALFGESHGPAIGITLSGFPAGLKLDRETINKALERRRPGHDDISTPRKELDQVEILSGIFNDHTTGAPITAIIRNHNTRSKDYSAFKEVMRPGQTDYSGRSRYDGFNDYRGSGHFSGRLTAPLVFAGSLCQQWLAQKGVKISGHIVQIASVHDELWTEEKNLTDEDIEFLHQQRLPVYNEEKAKEMKQVILEAKDEKDSVGGIIEIVVLGMPAGYGDPFFDSIESRLSHLVFSVPAIKGLEFGTGFALADMRGSKANDPFCYTVDGEISTKSNHNGGIIGGITIGRPIVFRTVVKPTASIGQRQLTINLQKKEEVELSIEGRHDPCIVPRVLPVLEAVTAIALMESFLTRTKSVEE